MQIYTRFYDDKIVYWNVLVLASEFYYMTQFFHDGYGNPGQMPAINIQLAYYSIDYWANISIDYTFHQEFSVKVGRLGTYY